MDGWGADVVEVVEVGGGRWSAKWVRSCALGMDGAKNGWWNRGHWPTALRDPLSWPFVRPLAESGATAWCRATAS